MLCPLSWYLRATALFLNSKDTTGTTLLHSLCLTFTKQEFNICFFPEPQRLVLIRAPPNESMVWLSCSFQTVGWSDHTIAATLRTHRGGYTPSVSHVGSNPMRALAVTISRMKKMCLTSGEVCPLCCPPHFLVVVRTREYWAEHWRQLQWSCRAEAAATPESLLLQTWGINIQCDNTRGNCCYLSACESNSTKLQLFTYCVCPPHQCFSTHTHTQPDSCIFNEVLLNLNNCKLEALLFFFYEIMSKKRDRKRLMFYFWVIFNQNNLTWKWTYKKGK